MTGNTTTLLLNTDDLFKRTIINNNVDIDSITPAIFIAQIAEVKRILTIPLYNKILTDYENDALTGNYETIYYEFVVEMLSYFSAAEFISTGGYKITNAGINKMIPEFGNPVEVTEVNSIVAHYRSLGNAIELAFRDWIKSPENSVPEYTLNCSNNSSSYGLTWFI